MKQVSRRELLLTGTTAGLMSAVSATTAAASVSTTTANKSKFGYCLNMSTIRGQNLPIEQEIDIAG